MKKEVIKFGLAFAFGLAASVHAADECSVQDTLARGGAHLVTSTMKGAIPGNSLGYQLWFDPNVTNGNSMTYYDNGLFKADWNNSPDFWANVGLTYDETNGKPHDYKKLSLSYNYTKTVESGNVFIGVHSWTTNPPGELFIVDDWASQMDEAYLGRKFAEYEVDGSKYAVYALMTEEGESWRGYPYMVRLTSIRETPRECGYMDITAHFNKFDELFTGQTDTIPNARGVRKNAVLKFGNLTDLVAAVEAFDNGKGSIDYAHLRFGDLYVEGSSSSVAPGSSASVPESSSVAASSSSATPESSSVADTVIPMAMPQMARVSGTDRNLVVFDMQGRVLGKVNVPAGTSADDAIFAKFGRPGVYMVQVGGVVKTLSVTR